jgi:probable Rubsico expression protein CbbX
MRTVKQRYAGLGMLLLVLIGALTLGWLQLNHLEFVTLVAAAFFFWVLFMVGRDGWRQTTPANLESRGIYADDSSIPISDPGLRREYGPMLPFALGRRTSTPPARRQAAPRAAGRSRLSLPAGFSGGSSPVAARQLPKSGQTRRRKEMLGQDATITLAEERRAAGVDDLFVALDIELVGLVPVKKKVEEIGSLLLVDRARQRFGLTSTRPNLHMCFTGAPGTGKTTVALMMADLLHRLGYLETDNLVHAMRDDLVAEYIGQTAPKTKRVLGRAMGGVLFIDEAYTLYRAEDSKDYGQECIDILMQVMENERSSLVVILAGYKDRMDQFFESNPGMRSRVAHHLDFAAYEVEELLAIGELMLGRSSYYLSDQAASAFRGYLSQQKTQSQFANARSIRNELESARLRHAHRLAAQPDRHWSKDDLMRLEPSDVLPLRD